MKVANGALAADVFHFGIDSFPFKIHLDKCFKSVVFPLWRPDPVLGLKIARICGAIVRNFALGTSAFADLSGIAASRFLAAAAESVILFCFVSESRKSHCNGCVKVANGALAADVFHCGIDEISC